MKPKRRSSKSPIVPKIRGSPTNITEVGDISGGKGFAIGPGAKAFVLEISGLFNFETLVKLIRQYLSLIIISIILEGLVIGLWSKYTDRFLIPIWVLILVMSILEMGIIAAFCLKSQSRYLRHYTIVCAISILALAVISASEYRRISYPPKFAPDTFGVALAQFGEGPDFKNTLRSREVSQVVLQQLMKQVQENPDLSFVQFRPIGLIRTREEAWADGSRMGADLVIWGQLQESEDQTILSFSILETPDKVSNPMFARVLPLYEMAATSFFRIGSRQSDEITRGTTAISSFTFGLAHFFKWNFIAATEAFDQALAATPAAPEDSYHYLVYLYYGLSLQRLWNLEEANQYFDKAIQIHPDDPAPWLARAWGNRSLRKKDEAEQDAKVVWNLCSKHIQLKPDNYAAYFDRAQANEILQDWDAALADYQTTKEKAPDLYIAYIGIDRILIILNRLPEAVQTIEEAIELAENSDANPAWAYVYLGHVQEARGDSETARSAFEKAIQLAPDVDYMHLRFGQFLETTGKPGDLAKAESEYRTNIAVTNNKAFAHADLARFFGRHNSLEEAIAEYRVALQYDQHAGEVWTELADVLTRLNRYEEAREAYNHAIEFDPQNLYSHLFFGNFLYNQGEYESAIRAWQRARQIDTDNCVLLLNLGQAYELLGDQSQTELLYHEADATQTEQDQQCRDEAARRLAGSIK